MARLLKEYSDIAIKSENFDGKIDFARIFGRPGPVHIEVGSGRGTFLVNQAKLSPDTNFLGIEWASRYYRYTVDRIGRWNLKNVRMLRTDAAAFISEFVPDTSVDCFHIYFPDPWPKKRHHKRRFICDKNLDQFLRCLRPSGTIRIATDHADYFEQIEKVLSAKSDCLRKIDFLPTATASIGEWVGSNFERKYLKENRPIYTTAVKKTEQE
jgi:tRNA (guanine-N7-)-methyltransferase